MFNKILFLMIFCHINIHAMHPNDKWQHDYFEYEHDRPKSTSKFEELYAKLEKISLDDKISFFDWEDSLINLYHDEYYLEDLIIMPSMLHKLYDFRRYISDEGFDTIYYLTTHYLKYACELGPIEISNFAKALNALHHIGIKFTWKGNPRENILKFIEKNIDRTASVSDVSKIFLSCVLLNVSLSPEVEKSLTQYVKSYKFNSRTNISNFIKIFAHYRLYPPKEMLKIYFKCPAYDIGNEIYLLWSLAISGLNETFFDLDYLKTCMDNLFEHINNSVKNDPDFEYKYYYILMNFSISTYKVLYKKDPSFYLDNDPEPSTDQTSACWNKLKAKLEKKYPKIEFEKYINIIGAPVDAYLNYHGQRFIIQFDGPTHFINRNGEYIFDGPTYAQTELLKRRNYIVIRIDYLLNEEGDSYKVIKEKIREFRPKNKRRYSESISSGSKKARHED